MRALALVTDAYGGNGGIARYNRDFLRALALSPHVAEIDVLPRTAEPGERPPAKVRVRPPRRGRAAYVLAALSLAARRRYDFVFCGHIHHAPLAAALGPPVWLQGHGIDVWSPPSRLAARAAARARLVTLVSRCSRRRFLACADLPPERARVLPNTFREMFAPGRPNAGTLARLQLDGARIVLTVSRLARSEGYKGHRLVIEALPRLRARAPDAVYVVVGDGDARADLEAFAQSCGVADAVRFLGKVDDADLLDLCRAASAFVMPSTGEGFGVAFVEAAACGAPVIGANRDGSLDALADGEIGRPIDPTADAVAAALIEALETPPPSRAQAAQRFAFANFAAHVDRLVQTFAR